MKGLLLSLLSSVTVCAAATAPTPARIVVREGRFVEKATGRPFVPLGANYYRVGAVKSGKQGHSAFCPGSYDAAYIEAMMASLAASGMNTVRTFHSYLLGDDGILASPQARAIAPGYAANLVHFLQQARRHGLRVIFTWDIWSPGSDWWSSEPLPQEERYGLLSDARPEMLVNAYRFTLAGARTRANAIIALIETIRKADAGLLPVVLAWELENELYFRVDHPPLQARQGTFEFGGRSYSLASDAETQALMDDVIVAWADLCAGAIRQADPDALVSAGLFTFAAVGRKGPGTLSQDKTEDNRVPARPMALLRSSLDYVDLHLYAWRTPDLGVQHFLEQNLRSAEWEDLRATARRLGKPVFVGETGVFANTLRRPPQWEEIDHALGLACFREHLDGLVTQGMAGALYWHYGNPDSTRNDECPVLALFPQYGEALRHAWRP